VVDDFVTIYGADYEGVVGLLKSDFFKKRKLRFLRVFRSFCRGFLIFVMLCGVKFKNFLFFKK
jgi:hypothetical protein